ncbi:hypothetical protein MCHI_001811, partial [Candidatus Magnetoovum chiemensis]
KYIVDNRDRDMFVLYIALIDNVRKDLFNEIMDVFYEFLDTNDWNIIENLRNDTYKRFSDARKHIIALQGL